LFKNELHLNSVFNNVNYILLKVKRDSKILRKKGSIIYLFLTGL